jgi:hypothetical protein
LAGTLKIGRYSRRAGFLRVWFRKVSLYTTGSDVVCTKKYLARKTASVTVVEMQLMERA